MARDYPEQVRGRYGSVHQHQAAVHHGAAQGRGDVMRSKPVRQTHGQAYAYDVTGAGFTSDGSPVPGKLNVAQLAGAGVSLALIIGLCVWGYRLMVRDVSGVPVIRAMSEEARLVPEDPGGQLAMHQGHAVNTVTADGSAAAPADRLVLPPGAMELADEDQPMGV